MVLTDLVNGFLVGWKYFSKENLDKTSRTLEGEAIVVDGPMQDELMQLVNQGSKFEKGGFYTAMVVRHPFLIYEGLYKEVKHHLRK